jgi:hypothetical protein
VGRFHWAIHFAIGQTGMPVCGMFDSLAEYPHWFVIACTFVAAGGVLWVLMKLIKMAMWAFFFAIVLVTVLVAAGLLLH